MQLLPGWQGNFRTCYPNFSGGNVKAVASTKINTNLPSDARSVNARNEWSKGSTRNQRTLHEHQPCERQEIQVAPFRFPNFFLD